MIDTWGFRERLAEGVEVELVAIPAGSFLMGSPADEPERAGDEGPQHEVQLEGFFLGQTPITQAQWQVVAGWEKVALDLNPDPAKFKGLNRPGGTGELAGGGGVLPPAEQPHGQAL